MLKIALSRHTGRMNQAMINILEQDSAVTRADILDPCDVLIDFSHPTVTIDRLSVCQERNIPCVIGTTGFTTVQKETLLQAAQRIPIVWAPNMSSGVALLLRLIALATESVGHDADIDIVDFHHKHKIDAPSGTALAMGETVARVLEKTLSEWMAHDKTTRTPGAVHFSSIRAGDVIGEHTAIFSWAGERIEITHKASDRSLFARGALRAAKWIIHQPPGLYSMQDVLSLSS